MVLIKRIAVTAGLRQGKRIDKQVITINSFAQRTPNQGYNVISLPYQKTFSLVPIYSFYVDRVTLPIGRVIIVVYTSLGRRPERRGVRTATYRSILGISAIVTFGLVIVTFGPVSRPYFINLFGIATLSGILSGFKGLISRSYYYISFLDPLRSLILVHLLYLGPQFC